MKLYYAPGACSLAAQITANEANIPVFLVKIDLSTKTTQDGANFFDINPKGCVPALELSDGRILTEIPAILQYLADLKPEKNLAEKPATFERAKVLEWLNFVATELQVNFSFAFQNPSDEQRKKGIEKLLKRFDFVEKQLEQSDFIASENFTIADAYLFTVLTWCPIVKIDYSDKPMLVKYFNKLSERESVKNILS
ncbi:glutathione transferase GstA [Bartonella tamiae]|uniref:Glutathione S-transferase n=1 Tax=Bartonella tamiae Th239 TaxID=1094558 RepID=J1JYX2_9HYPH|nr:glutathione transferase GstA [Bartonella tamiae]EJF90302.1 hypothetical protein ME5_00703 [Bartonella tamiae Th239]EJF93757.1 hypothetical protein MEG_01181 [Bartonella tamiae Th307]